MKRFKLLFLPALLIIFTASCAKKGCNDDLAQNYDPEAEENDQSCQYAGNVVFWCLPAVSDSLKNIEGHIMLRFELEGEMVDSTTTETFFAAAGECGLTGAKTIKQEFTGNSERYYKYRIRGLNYQTIYEDFITIKANDCLNIQLE
jgi:hypothetical protein